MAESILVIGLAFVVGFILIVRLFGAWMLRINEVIKLLKEIKILLGGKEEKEITKREEIQKDDSFDIEKFRR